MGLVGQRQAYLREPVGHRERRSAERRGLVGTLVALDAAMLVLVVATTDFFRVWLETVLKMWPLATERHLIASILVTPILLTIFRFEGLYDLDQILAGTREYARIAHSITYGVFIAVVVSYAAGRQPIVSRLWLVLIWVLAIGAVCGERFVTRRVVRRLRQGGALRTRVVVVGASTLGVEIAQQLLRARTEGIDVLGFLDEYLPIGHRLAGDLAVIGRPSDLVDGGLSGPGDLADEYVIVPQALPSERVTSLTRLMVAGGGPTVRMAVSPSDLLTNGIVVAQRGSIPLVTLQRLRIRGIDALLKRSLDLVVGTLGLLVTALPIVVALALSVLEGRRPILVKRLVQGEAGEPIALWLVAEEVTTAVWLRGALTLLAVIRGDLSLVGPRPVAWGPFSEPGTAVGLAAVKPGLTGSWRVRALQLTPDEQALEDLTYVRNYSIWEDLRILAATIGRSAGISRRPIGRWQAQQALTELDRGPVASLPS
jgi:lipopolysaccharide/colanic/teichoic acid biosynthesis glycosyltransferase